MNAIDDAVNAALNGHAVPGYYTFFLAVTMLGQAYLWVLALLPCLLSRRLRAIAAILIVALLFGMAVNDDVKELVMRPRPEGAIAGSYFTPHSYSFPSGHTQTAFMIATILSAFIALRYNLITYLLATAVGFSRLYLGAHYFTDVVTGACAGLLIGWLALYAADRYGLIARRDTLPFSLHVLGRRPAGDGPEVKDITSLIIVLALGYSGVIALLLASQYALSLALVALVYALLLYVAHAREKVRHHSSKQAKANK